MYLKPHHHKLVYIYTVIKYYVDYTITLLHGIGGGGGRLDFTL